MKKTFLPLLPLIAVICSCGGETKPSNSSITIDPNTYYNQVKENAKFDQNNSKRIFGGIILK